MKKILLLIALITSPLALSLDEQTLIQHLTIKNTQKGQFQQTRQLKNLPYPIKSQGEYTLNKEELHWHTQSPIENQIKINQEGIWQQNAQQWTRQQNISEKTQSQLLLALFKGDTASLKQHFALELSGDKENWQLELKPKSQILKQIFHKIEIQGAEHIQKITIEETQGDTNTIELTPHPKP